MRKNMNTCLLIEVESIIRQLKKKYESMSTIPPLNLVDECDEDEVTQTPET